MEKHGKILEDSSGRHKDEDGNRIYHQWEVNDAMNDVAKQAFEYGRYSGNNASYINGFNDGFNSSSNSFDENEDISEDDYTFEDYLKEIK